MNPAFQWLQNFEDGNEILVGSTIARMKPSLAQAPNSPELIKNLQQRTRKIDYAVIDHIAGNSYGIGFSSSQEALPTIQRAWREVGGEELRVSKDIGKHFLEDKMSNDALIIVESESAADPSEHQALREHLGHGSWANTSIHHDATKDSLNAVARFILLVAIKHPLIIESGDGLSGEMFPSTRI